MTNLVVFDPLLPMPVLIALAVALVAGLALAIWRGLSGWALRALAGAAILGAIAQPSLVREDRAPLDDIVIVAVDASDSQQLADRAETTEAAAADLIARLDARDGTTTRRVDIVNEGENLGTQAMAAVSKALAEEPRARVSGVILISDGQVHDMDATPSLPAPMHLLLTGSEEDWDRRMIVENAPAFAILGEEVLLTLRIEDQGAAPAATQTVIDIAVDGEEPQRFNMPIGQNVNLPIRLPHGGRNVIEFSTPAVDGELTDRNNRALIQINGVRDRLRVLLVSGEPHAGTRTWRNLLKSDSSVDLVHFTILRPPDKQDGVPVSDLSLIAFPTRELFLDKVDDFDLIIFDRYKRRGILPALYLDNVRGYIERGGAVLINAGPDFASADSLFRSPLGQALPGEPTARVVERAFAPTVTEIGDRHPVTAGLGTPADWGRWLRQVELSPRSGDIVMSGVDDAPLLMLDRVGEGRVALLASDQAWLWSRGYEGGGPQLELLRRLAHWMMKEPDLEEEALLAEATGQTMRIIRRTLGENVGDVTLTSPSGRTFTLPLAESAPGRFETTFTGTEIGLYRLEEGEHSTVIGLGPASPKEFEATISTGEVVAPALESMRGGVHRLENGAPRIREVREGRPAAGRGWIGLTPRAAYETLSVSHTSLLPAWLVLLVIAALTIGAWLREGRS
ncbi:hypothetical protein [Pseudaestuariivita atlantica]|uniref:Membrane protein n=1 Tax=Pseudaestuariivita atlantica TaxID=1317121 RepID=A0A0L1JPS1_9RHOB|nr:hypothetical protein [Pseudaestuariivita atlantica]KNG93764.1 membrane protein [Pseudaestuariivita atlantica]